MPDVDLNGQSVLIAVAVVLIVLEAISIVWKGIEAWGNLTGKKKRQEEMTQIRNDINGLGARVSACEKRLEQGDKQFESAAKDTGQMLVVLDSLLVHFISGNDHEKLKETQKELTAYMAKRSIT